MELTRIKQNTKMNRTARPIREPITAPAIVPGEGDVDVNEGGADVNEGDADVKSVGDAELVRNVVAGDIGLVGRSVFSFSVRLGVDVGGTVVCSTGGSIALGRSLDKFKDTAVVFGPSVVNCTMWTVVRR